jgi:8-oxo-dGTP pyrophosphatase MutT (NUDIX family)
MSAQPVPASTLVLVRPGEAGLLVYLVRRSAESRFLPGTYVFPGGVVEAQDRDPAILKGHVDLDGGEVDSRLGRGLQRDEALAFAVAAVRETFEETGVLLARLGAGGAAATPLGPPSSRRDGFLVQVVQRPLVLTISRLRPWAHWITPEALAKRFDTRFFVAALPDGQACAPDETETTHGIWLSPREALERNHAGESALSPPTLTTLHELAPYAGVEDLLHAAEVRTWGEPRTPRLLRGPDGPVILLPWDPLYGEPIPGEALAQLTTLPPGTPFSRLGMRHGFWRPVR